MSRFVPPGLLVHVVYWCGDGEREQTTPYRSVPWRFKVGPLSAMAGGRPYAHVPCKDAHFLIERFPTLFKLFEELPAPPAEAKAPRGKRPEG